MRYLSRLRRRREVGAPSRTCPSPELRHTDIVHLPQQRGLETILRHPARRDAATPDYRLGRPAASGNADFLRMAAAKLGANGRYWQKDVRAAGTDRDGATPVVREYLGRPRQLSTIS